MRQTTDKYLRQMHLVTPTQLKFPILIIGAGGIGSWTTLCLCKMGAAEVMVVDHDFVELHNSSSQLYSPTQKGVFKTPALKDIVETLTGINIFAITAKIQEITLPKITVPGFMIPEVILCAVDSLEERKKIWEHVKGWGMRLYIDGRMGGNVFRIITVDMTNDEDVLRYERMLASKTKAHPEPCSGRSIAYNTLGIAAQIGNTIKKYAKKEEIVFDYTYDFETQRGNL